jgi:hypothetical protein
MKACFCRKYERKLPEELPVIAVSNNDAVFLPGRVRQKPDNILACVYSIYPG